MSIIPAIAGPAPDLRALKFTGQTAGSHGAQIYADRDGHRWLIKHRAVGEQFVSTLQDATARLQSFAGLTTPETFVLDGGAGTAQRMFTDVEPVDFNHLSANDVLTLQKHNVFDWLIGNHDSHARQFLRTSTGEIVGIDKDQAFKYYGRDPFGYDFRPNDHEPIYNRLWRDFAAGTTILNDPRRGELGEFVQRLQSLNDEDVRELFRPYAQGAADAGRLVVDDPGGYYPGWEPGSPVIVPNDPEAFLAAVVDRKNSLVGDFGELYAGTRDPAAQLDPDVDPTNVTGVLPTATNPDAAIFFRTDSAPVYREDARPPEVIFEQGFAPRDPSFTDLRAAHDINAESAFVSTTQDARMHYLVPTGPDTPVYRYMIEAPGGIDVSRTLGSNIRHGNEHEIAFPGGIRRENILGAQRILPYAVQGTNPDGSLRFETPDNEPFEPNPRFNPLLPNVTPPPLLGRVGGGAPPPENPRSRLRRVTTIRPGAAPMAPDTDSISDGSDGHELEPEESPEWGYGTDPRSRVLQDAAVGPPPQDAPAIDSSGAGPASRLRVGAGDDDSDPGYDFEDHMYVSDAAAGVSQSPRDDADGSDDESEYGGAFADTSESVYGVDPVSQFGHDRGMDATSDVSGVDPDYAHNEAGRSWLEEFNETDDVGVPEGEPVAVNAVLLESHWWRLNLDSNDHAAALGAPSDVTNPTVGIPIQDNREADPANPQSDGGGRPVREDAADHLAPRDSPLGGPTDVTAVDDTGAAETTRDDSGRASTDVGFSEDSVHPTGIVDVRGNPVLIPEATQQGTQSPHLPVFTADRPSAQFDPRVDAASIEVGYENPNGIVHFRTDGHLLFREDTRGPEEIFRKGFRPRKPGVTNLSHMAADMPSAFVSTSRNPNLHHLGQSKPGEPVYRYVIDAPGGVDVTATFGQIYGGDHEHEVAFPGGIRTENIVGAQKVLTVPTPAEMFRNEGTAVRGDFVPNVKYRPDAPNPRFPAAQPAPAAGLETLVRAEVATEERTGGVGGNHAEDRAVPEGQLRLGRMEHQSDLGARADEAEPSGSSRETEDQNRPHRPTGAPVTATARGRGGGGSSMPPGTAERLSSDAGAQQPTRLRDNDFGGRRGEAQPTGTFSERFEASTEGPDGRGFLKGLTTQVSYDQRRFQLPDGSWVRDFEIRLSLQPGSGIDRDDVMLLQQRLGEAIDRHLNDRYELPGGDKLNVTLIFDSRRPHGTVTVHGATDTDQQNFSMHAPGGVLAHEILHYLGLPEGYRDATSLLNRGSDPDGPMGEQAARGEWRLSSEQLATIDDIAHHGPVHDLPHGAAPLPIQPREVLHHEPAAAHQPTRAPSAEQDVDDGMSAPPAAPRPVTQVTPAAVDVRSGGVDGGQLDDRFGEAVDPKNVKRSERDDHDQLRLNPLWYRLENFKPALLDRGGVWLYAVDEDGEVFIGSEDVWSIADEQERNRLFDGMREHDPHLTMDALKAAVNDQGVPTVAAGFTDSGVSRIRRGRIGGELFKDPVTGRWRVDASSRYTGPVVRPGVAPARVTQWVRNAADQIGGVLGFAVGAQDAEHPRIAHKAFVADTDTSAFDPKYGPLAGPKKVKDREVDDQGQLRLNPLWYRLEDFKPALLERTGAVWHFTVDQHGEILLGSDALLTIAEEGELQNLLEAMQDKDPALTMDELKAYLDNQGHPTVAAGFDDTGATRSRPARISGELSYQGGQWLVTDKSGRYMSNKVRPGLDVDAAQGWLSNVADQMSQRFEVPVAAQLFKNSTAPQPAPHPVTEVTTAAEDVRSGGVDGGQLDRTAHAVPPATTAPDAVPADARDTPRAMEPHGDQPSHGREDDGTAQESDLPLDGPQDHHHRIAPEAVALIDTLDPSSGDQPSDTLFLSFEEGSKAVDGQGRAEVAAFVSKVVSKAERRRDAGQGGLRLYAQGGGNGGIFGIRSEGPEAVGMQRARAVLNEIRPLIELALLEKELPPGFVSLADPMTRGRALTNDIPGSAKQARRVVVVRSENQRKSDALPVPQEPADHLGGEWPNESVDASASWAPEGVIRFGVGAHQSEDGVEPASNEHTNSSDLREATPRQVTPGADTPSRAERLRQSLGQPAPALPMSDEGLEHLLASVPRELSTTPTLAECGPLANWLIHELHPGRLHGLATSDDSVLDLGGVAGAQARVVAGPGWGKVRDLSEVGALVRVTPGTSAVIMVSHADNDTGHVFALHSVAGKRLRLLDPQRTVGERVSGIDDTTLAQHPDVRTATATWAFLVDNEGRVIEPSTWSQPISATEAVLDAPLSHDFGSGRGRGAGDGSTSIGSNLGSGPGRQGDGPDAPGAGRSRPNATDTARLSSGPIDEVGDDDRSGGQRSDVPLPVGDSTTPDVPLRLEPSNTPTDDAASPETLLRQESGAGVPPEADDVDGHSSRISTLQEFLGQVVQPRLGRPQAEVLESNSSDDDDPADVEVEVEDDLPSRGSDSTLGLRTLLGPELSTGPEANEYHGNEGGFISSEDLPVDPPDPPLPARIGKDLLLGGMDVVERFYSGNGALDHFRHVVNRAADDGGKTWNNHRERITALFSDDGLRPKVAGLLRGGRTVVYTIDLGTGRRGTLTLGYRLDGAAANSELSVPKDIEQRYIKDYEFEHSSDPTSTIGTFKDGRSTLVVGVQGNVSAPAAHLNETATLFGRRDHEWAQIDQRADRQISGGQTTEPGTRFAGNIRAVLTHVLSRSPDEANAHHVDYATAVVVPTRDVEDQSWADAADEASNVVAPLPSSSTRSVPASPTDPPRIRDTRALNSSDVVTNFWLVPDDLPATQPDGPVAQQGPTRGPRRQTVNDFINSAPMKDAFEKAYGRQSSQAMNETSSWLTVELVQANLHLMTNKQPLVLPFEGIPGGRLEVHAFVEPIGTASAIAVARGTGRRDAPSGRLLRLTGKTKQTEFHYGTETDTSQTRQDLVTYSGQIPVPGRFRANGGTDSGEAQGGLDATVGRGRTRNETDSRQFRVRSTIKNPVGGQAWRGQVRLRFVMHTPSEVSASGHIKPFKGAVQETRGSFDVLTEESAASPIEDYTGETVWAPPTRIWSKGPPPIPHWIATSPWWRFGTGGRTMQRGSVTGPDEAPAPVHGSPLHPEAVPPSVPRGKDAVAELVGLGSMDRVTNLDLSGFHGMLDLMGQRAFGGDWAKVRPRVSTGYHLNRVRAAMTPMTQHSPLTLTELSGPRSSTKASLTADIERLTFQRMINTTLSSPSSEMTTGSATTINHNKQTSLAGAVGGRAGDVEDSTVFFEALGGVNITVRDGDRVRNQERVVVATKFDQPMAIFGGWVRLDATLTGSMATVHESGLFPVEIAIPLSELQGSRTHDAERPPTFTRDNPTGFVHEPPVKDAPLKGVPSVENPSKSDAAGDQGDSPGKEPASAVPNDGQLRSGAMLREPGPSTQPESRISFFADPDPDAIVLSERKGTVDSTTSLHSGRRSTVDSTTPLLRHADTFASLAVSTRQLEEAIGDTTAPANALENEVVTAPPPLNWDPPSRPADPPKPPAHAEQGSWHPSDFLVGVDPQSGLIEAIRQDLAPALGSHLDGAMNGVTNQFGPNVLVARLTHESGQVWSHDIALPGGKVTVTVRPVREKDWEHVGVSKKFETDISTESQASTGHVYGKVVRDIKGFRVQVPVPHGSIALQVTHSASVHPKRSVGGAVDQGVGQLADVSGPNIAGEQEQRIPVRLKTVEEHNLFRQRIHFDITYESHGSAKALPGIPSTPESVRLTGVFSYPKSPEDAPPESTAPGGSGQARRQLAVHEVVDKVRPDAAGVTAPVDGEIPGPLEDLVASHVLDSLASQGRAVFAGDWPKVRAELAPHVRTIPTQRTLGDHSRGGTRTIRLQSVRGASVVLGARIDTVSSAGSTATSELYSGGQQFLTAGVSNTKLSTWEGYLQGQGDVLPTGDAVNLSVQGRVSGVSGTEAVDTRTESSATGLLFRQKTSSQTQVGTATITVQMNRPTGLFGLRESRNGTGEARIFFQTRQSPTDAPENTTYAPRPGIVRIDPNPLILTPHSGPARLDDSGIPNRGLSPNSIVRDITDAAGFRAQTLTNLRAMLKPVTMLFIKDQVDKAITGTQLARDLPAMSRGEEVELFRQGDFRITGIADITDLEFTRVEEKGGNANILNEVNQTRVIQPTRVRELGWRALLGPHWRLDGDQVTVRAGGGSNHRQRTGPTYSQTVKVSANAKFARSYAVFDGTSRIFLKVHDGRTNTPVPLPPVDVHGPILIPRSETHLVVDPVPSLTERPRTPTEQPSRLQAPPAVLDELGLAGNTISAPLVAPNQPVIIPADALSDVRHVPAEEAGLQRLTTVPEAWSWEDDASGIIIDPTPPPRTWFGGETVPESPISATHADDAPVSPGSSPTDDDALSYLDEPQTDTAGSRIASPSVALGREALDEESGEASKDQPSGVQTKLDSSLPPASAAPVGPVEVPARSDSSAKDEGDDIAVPSPHGDVVDHQRVAGVDAEVPTVADTRHELAEIDDWLRAVNRDRNADDVDQRSVNCVLCAISVFDRLSGRATFRTAPPVRRAGPNARELANALDVAIHRTTPEQIEALLRAQGSGAHTMVVVVRTTDPSAAAVESSSAHVVNAFFDGQNVHAIDGQRGSRESWPPDLDGEGEPVFAWGVLAPADAMSAVHATVVSTGAQGELADTSEREQVGPGGNIAPESGDHQSGDWTLEPIGSRRSRPNASLTDGDGDVSSGPGQLVSIGRESSVSTRHSDALPAPAMASREHPELTEEQASLVGSTKPFEHWDAFANVDPRSESVLDGVARVLDRAGVGDAADRVESIKRAYGVILDDERRRNTTDLTQILVNRVTTGASYAGPRGGARSSHSTVADDLLKMFEPQARDRALTDTEKAIIETSLEDARSLSGDQATRLVALGVTLPQHLRHFVGSVNTDAGPSRPGDTSRRGGSSQETRPSTVTRTSLSARKPAWDTAGLPHARPVGALQRQPGRREVPGPEANDVSAPSKASGPETGSRTSKGIAGPPKRGAEQEIESGRAAKRPRAVRKDADPSASAAFAVDIKLTAEVIEAMLRDLKTELNKPEDVKRVTATEIARRHRPATYKSDKYWLSSASWKNPRQNQAKRLSMMADYREHRQALQDLLRGTRVYEGDLPEPSDSGNRSNTAADFLRALRAVSEFQTAQRTERITRAYDYLAMKSGIPDRQLKSWIKVDGEPRISLREFSTMPGYAENRDRLAEAFRRLDHAEIADGLPAARDRNYRDRVTAEDVARGLGLLSQGWTQQDVFRELDTAKRSLGAYLHAGKGGLKVEGQRLAKLPHYAEWRDSIEASLLRMNQRDQARRLPVGRIKAADFLATMRGHRVAVADAIRRMRNDPGLSARDAAAAAGVPWQAFSIAVGAGPRIRNRTRVDDQLESVKPHLEDGLDTILEHLEDLASGRKLEEPPMTKVGFTKGTKRWHLVHRQPAEESGGHKLGRLYAANPELVRHPRSYEQDRPRQLLRWMSTVIRERFPTAREVQAYFDAKTKTIYVSSNIRDDNRKIRELLGEGAGLGDVVDERPRGDRTSRETRHWHKLRNALAAPVAHAKDGTTAEILDAMKQSRFRVPDRGFSAGKTSVHLHAERRIKHALEDDGLGNVNLDLLAGTRRACGHCAAAMDFGVDRPRGPFWQSAAGGAFLDGDGIIEDNMARSIGSYVTRTRRDRKITADYNTDSDSSDDESGEELDAAAALPAGRAKGKGVDRKGKGKAVDTEEESADTEEESVDSDVASVNAEEGGVDRKGNRVDWKGKGKAPDVQESVDEELGDSDQSRATSVNGDVEEGMASGSESGGFERGALEFVLSRLEAGTDVELDPGDRYVIAEIRRGAFLPGDLADRFARLGVGGPRFREDHVARQQNVEAGPSGHGHEDVSAVAAVSMPLDSPGSGSSMSISTDSDDGDVDMDDVRRDDDPNPGPATAARRR